MEELIVKTSWENNITFDRDDDVFDSVFSNLDFPLFLKPLKKYTKRKMKAAWLEAKRHEALKH